MIGGLLPRGPLAGGLSVELRVQISRMPPESPVRMSPLLRKVKHWMNFGFSYFCNSSRMDRQSVNHRQTNGRKGSSGPNFSPTPKMPCLRANEVPDQVQKKMWDFPQVTMVFGSVGWNSTARTTSLVVWKGWTGSVRGQSEQSSRDEQRASP